MFLWLAFVFCVVCCPLGLRAAVANIPSTDPTITYQGGWEAVRANGTSYVVSNTTGSKAFYTFTGQPIRQDGERSYTKQRVIQGPEYPFSESYSRGTRPGLRRYQSTASTVPQQRSTPIPETRPDPCITCSSTGPTCFRTDSIPSRSSTSVTSSLSGTSK